MENLKSGFKTIIITLAITFSLTGCTQIINVLDFIGVIPPWEHKLEFQLGKQAIEEPFTFADYCEEKYDSIFLVYPYFNTERTDYTTLRMSKNLRRLCNGNTNFETLSTLLFIKDSKVEAYSEIERIDADFASREVEKHYIFPIDQKFIMDKGRNIHVYN
ncbi:MAG: hypothetical protein J6Q48_06970 [Bacteroidaceae bacterium]|nr:hypothetical protein [Bacteroidaceae bacterium]